MLWEDLMRLGGWGSLPDDYLTFDIETTGSTRDDDLPLDFGWCLVRDREMVDAGGFILNWYAVPELVDWDWLDYKLFKMAEVFRHRGANWVYNRAKLTSDGKDPLWVMQFAHDLLKTNHDAGVMTAGQNVRVFDKQMLEAVFGEYLKQSWPVPMDRLMDTGCLEKAVQSEELHVDPQYHLLPTPGEGFADFQQRVYGRRLPLVKWSVQHCVKRYGVAVDADQLHGAAYDSWVIHKLIEANRCQSRNQSPSPTSSPLTQAT